MYKERSIKHINREDNMLDVMYKYFNTMESKKIDKT